MLTGISAVGLLGPVRRRWLLAAVDRGYLLTAQAVDNAKHMVHSGLGADRALRMALPDAMVVPPANPLLAEGIPAAAEPIPHR